MTTCDPSSIKEKTTDKSSYGACALDPPELFTEHDVDYIQSQLTNPVDPQLIRDTLNDNYGDIDGTISYLLTIDIPVTPQPTVAEDSNESIEKTVVEDSNESIVKIMSITGIYDVDLVQQSFAANNLDIDLTVESLLKLTTNDNEKNEVISDEEISETEQTTKKTTTKNRPVSSRQAKIDKKKAKKQRATDKHRAEILAASEKKPSKQQAEEKSDPPANNAEENIVPANMEFIRI
jgi:hypothetical protein